VITSFVDSIDKIRENIWQVLLLLILGMLSGSYANILGYELCSKIVTQFNYSISNIESYNLYNPNILSGMPTIFATSKINFLFFDSLFTSFSFTLGFGAIGVYLFLSARMKISRWIAVIASCIFIMFPFFQELYLLGNLSDLRFFAALPWFLFGLHYLRNEYSFLSFSVFTIFLTTLIRTSNIQTFYFLLLFSFIFFLITFIEYLIAKQILSFFKFFLLVYLGFTISILACAQTFFSFFEFFENYVFTNSYVSGSGIFFEMIDSRSSYFLGANILLIFFFGIKKNLNLFLITLCFLIMPLFYHFLPFSYLIKNLDLFYGFSAIFIIILFGVGLDRILKSRKKFLNHKQIEYISFFCIILISILCFLWWKGNTSLAIFLLFSQIIIFLMFLLLLIKRNSLSHSKYILLSSLLLLWIYPIVNSLVIVQKQYSPKEDYTKIDKLLKRDNSEYRIFPIEGMFYDNYWARKNQTIGGYQQIIKKSYSHILENCLEAEIENGIPINWNIVNMLGVKYILRKDGSLKFDNLQYVDYDRKSKISIYRNRDFLSKLWFVDDLLILKNQQNIFNTLNQIDFNPQSTAIIENQLNYEIKKPSNYSAKILKNDNDEITLRVFTNTNSFLVLSQIYDDDWYAFENDTNIKTYRVNHILTGLFLRKGLHYITLKYSPISNRIFGIFSLSFLIFEMIILIIGILSYIRKNYASRTIYILKEN